MPRTGFRAGRRGMIPSRPTISSSQASGTQKASQAIRLSSGVDSVNFLASPRMLESILRAIRFLLSGQFRRVWNEGHVWIYRLVWEIIFPSSCRSGGKDAPPRSEPWLSARILRCVRIADHIAPKGAAVNNSTNKKFILQMDAKLHGAFGRAADDRSRLC